MSGVSIRARTVASGRRFDVRYRRGGRYTAVEHGGTFTTKREAEIRARAIADWLAAGLDPKVELVRVAQPSQTIAELQAEWLAGKRRITEATRRGYESQAKRLERDLGDTRVDALTVQDVIAWIGDLSDDLEPSTIGAYVRQLRAVLDLIEDRPNVARSRRVELPRVIRDEIDPPDAPDVLALLRRLDADVLFPAIAMEQLGSRVSETLALRADDVQADGVRFRREETKGQRRSRLVPCAPVIAEAIAERIPFSTTRVTVWRKLTATSAIHPHLLRHRRGSLWHQQGVPAVELARRLGHGKASVSLDVYSHAKPLAEIDPHDLASLFR